MDVLELRNFEKLSPFEIKDELIKLAKKSSRTTQSAFLNAGRGNPNWVATTPREGYFLLGQFAVTESKRVMEHPAGLGGMPQARGIASRLEAWLAKHADVPGAVVARMRERLDGLRGQRLGTGTSGLEIIEHRRHGVVILGRNQDGFHGCARECPHVALNAEATPTIARRAAPGEARFCRTGEPT